MRIEKFEKRRLISGRLRSGVKTAVLASLATPDFIASAAGRRRRYLIILGHMRAGSSLLTNIIAQSREACGYGETFTVYRSRRSFHMLVARIRLHGLRYGRFRLPEPLVVDKALHSGLTPDPRVLDHPDARILFLIRDGVRSVRSMVHEFEIDEGVAAGYYIERVASLCDLASELHERRPLGLVTFESLTGDTDRALRRISEFSGLGRPLKATFSASKGADRPGVGDPSGRVRAGEILKTERTLGAELSPSVASRVTAAYEQALSSLKVLCEPCE